MWLITEALYSDCRAKISAIIKRYCYCQDEDLQSYTVYEGKSIFDNNIGNYPDKTQSEIYGRGMEYLLMNFLS